ncbi:MAG: hypothetical protein WC307_01080 [Candidatus Nanoarchaeia archaeon]|jgi:hypothetical protein
MFNKKKVKQLNDLLNKVKDHRDEFIKTLEELCPNKDCDPQLETSKEAVNCEYFTLCNALGSYSLISDEERVEADEFLEEVYKSIERRKKPSEIYS